MGNTDEPSVVKADPKDWFKKPKRPPTLDPEWNEGKTVDNKPTQKWLSDLAKAETSSKTFDDLMSTLIDFNAFIMNHLQISDLTQDILIGDRYPFDLSKPLPLVQSRNHQIVLVDYFFNNDLVYLKGESTGRTYTTSLTKTKAAKYDLPGIKAMIRLFNLKGENIVHLAATLRMFTRRIVIQKRVEDLQLGVESYQKKLNISKPRTREENLSRRAPYTTLSDPQGVIYEDKLNIKILMRFDEIYKFSDGTLQLIRDTLHDMATNLRMGYNKAMPKRRWSHLDKTRSHIMVKEIDHQLRETRLMRSLEKFIGSRHYEEDLRLLQWII
ncbi:hypothetical protein Tco_1282322 [Tanacetum coccineum]